jgi:hypothetical protein
MAFYVYENMINILTMYIFCTHLANSWCTAQCLEKCKSSKSLVLIKTRESDQDQDIIEVCGLWCNLNNRRTKHCYRDEPFAVLFVIAQIKAQLKAIFVC